MIESVRQDGAVKMPPGGRLSPDDIDTLAEWIARGAPWGSALRLVNTPQVPQLPFEIWKFDRLQEIGDHPAIIVGHPRVIETALGRAVEFNGVDDALFLDIHPLAEAGTFTWEVIFRPDRGGTREQRFFHLQERDPKTGLDTANRLLFEIRVIGDRWCLDSFAMSAAGSRTLLDRGRLHPLGAWYHVAMVYDGREFRNYVDGVLQGAAELRWTPHGPGHSSAGVRINRVDYFKGAIRLARMTRGALSPSEFLKQ